MLNGPIDRDAALILSALVATVSEMDEAISTDFMQRFSDNIDLYYATLHGETLGLLPDSLGNFVQLLGSAIYQVRDTDPSNRVGWHVVWPLPTDHQIS